jgi:hypothetical protein
MLAHKRLVNLEPVHCKALQVAQVGVAGAEVVDGEFAPPSARRRCSTSLTCWASATNSDSVSSSSSAAAGKLAFGQGIGHLALDVVAAKLQR